MEENLILNPHANQVLKRFGVNTYGMPILRMVWSDSRIWYLAGEWRPKYPQNPGCWIVEALQPPEQYGEKLDWYKHDLGPFPDKGDYEFVMAFMDDGQWYNASEHQLQALMRAVEETVKRSSMRIRSDIAAEQAAKDREAKRIIGDIVNDARPAIHSRIHEEESSHERSTPPVLPQNVTGSYLISGESK